MILPAHICATRRHMLGAMAQGVPGIAMMATSLLAMGLPHRAARAQALSGAFADGAQMTVAGPEGGELDHWSRVILPALGAFPPAKTVPRRSLAGGVDGVTGANQFGAQALPDGTSALLAPGSALLAWLRGERAVQYDPTRWIPVLGGFSSAVVVARFSASQLTRGQKIRVGTAGLNGPELAVVLGLARLGLQPMIVSGVGDQAAAEIAFAQRAVDILLLRGPAIASTLASTDAQPLCVLGVPDMNGLLGRDPYFADLPHLGELLDGVPADPLGRAWRASVVAAQLAFVLILPHLSAAGAVALWRQAIEPALATAELQAMATAQGIRLQTDPAALTAMTVGAEAHAALRAWIAGLLYR